MKLAVAPTVFIGLGGTGTLVLQKLRQRLEHRLGTADLPFLRYLYVDTHGDSARKALQGLDGKRLAWSAANVVSPSDNVLRCIQDPNMDSGVVSRRLHISDWFDERMRQRLSTVGFSMGVGGQRMFSHLAFVGSSNLAALRQTLIDYYQELLTTRDLRGRDLEDIEPSYLRLTATRVLGDVRFVAVASSGGGTGSGCFIDLGFLLRRLRRDLHWTGVSQTGYAALARAGVSKDLEIRNTAALLTELDHYDGSMPYDYNYLTNQDGASVAPEKNPPYDLVFLSMPAQQDRPLAADPGHAFDLLQWKIAEHLLAQTVAVYRDQVPDEKVKLPVESSLGAIAWDVDANANNPKGFFTFGVSSREWPAALVTRHLFNHLTREGVGRFTQVDPGTIAKEVAQRCRALGVPDEGIRKNRTPRMVQEDLLFQELVRPFAGYDPVAQMEGCRARAFDDRGRLKPGGLVEAANALKEQFQARHGEPVANQPGITYAVLHGNRTRLLGQDGEPGLARKLALDLLELCGSKGPAIAAEVTRGLRGAVAEERAFLVEGLAEVKPQAQESPRTLEECWQFANSSLLQQVLERKKEIYDDLGPWLEKLARRFDNFALYLASYREIQSPSAASQLNGDAPFLLLPRSEVDRLEKAVGADQTGTPAPFQGRTTDRHGLTRPGIMEQLRALINQGLPEEDAEARPTLFASGPPKKEGRADYSHLQELESQAFQRVASAPGKANPYNIEVLSLMKEEAERTGRPFPNLLQEAEPLIQFHTGAAEYLNLSFGKAGTQWSRIVQADQDGYQELLQQETQGRAWMQHWKGGTQEDSVHHNVTDQWCPWSVTYSVERSSIKSHLVIGYDLESRQALLYGGADKPDWFPAVSDRRIKLVPSTQALEDAMTLLFGSIVLGRWTFIGQSEGFEFRYERQDEAGRPIPEIFRVVSDMNTASRELSHRPDVREALRRNIHSYLRDNLGLAADSLNKAVATINKHRLEHAGQRTGDLVPLQLYQVHYDQALDGLLRFCTAFQIPLPTVPHEYARYVKREEPRPGQGAGAPQDGWYCTRCGHLFGLTMPGRTLDCPNCGLPNR